MGEREGKYWIELSIPGEGKKKAGSTKESQLWGGVARENTGWLATLGGFLEKHCEDPEKTQGEGTWHTRQKVGTEPTLGPKTWSGGPTMSK